MVLVVADNVDVSKSSPRGGIVVTQMIVSVIKYKVMRRGSEKLICFNYEIEYK